MSTTLSAFVPHVITLASGQLVNVRRVTPDILYDLVTLATPATETTAAIYATTQAGQAVPPIAGFDPMIATAWPTDDAIAAAITTPAAPTPTVPASVTPRQLRQWLIASGKLEAVTDALGAISDPTQAALAQNWWGYSSVYERAHPLVAQIGAALSMSSADIDAAFIAAAAL